MTVLACSDDLGAAARIKDGLAHWDIDASVTTVSLAADRAVVLVSAAAAGDPGWVSAVAHQASATRLIPVTLESVAAGDVPQPLRDLNWIAWHGRSAGPAADLYIAINSDPAIYETHRALSQEAAAWLQAGRDDDLLLRDRRRVKAAEHHLVAARDDAVSRVTLELEAFVTASARASGLVRRHRLRRWAVRSVVVGVFAALAFYVVHGIREATDATRLRFAVDLALNPDNLGRQAELASAVLVQGGGGDRDIIRGALRTMLGAEWGEGPIALKHDAFVFATAVAPKRQVVFTADAKGTLTTWDRRTGVPQTRTRLSRGALVAVDVTPDGSLAVAAGDEAAWFVAPAADGTPHRVDVPFSPSGVAIGRSVAVVWSGTAIEVFDAHTRRRLDGLRGLTNVLDVRVLRDGRVLALVRRGQELEIREPATGRTLARHEVDPWKFERGALGPDGRSAAITSSDRQVRYATRRLAFRSTGIPVVDATNGLAILDGSRAIVASPDQGVRLVDLRTGVTLGNLCLDLPTTERIRLVPGESTVICSSIVAPVIWGFDRYLSLRKPPDLVRVSRKRKDTRDAARVVARRDGHVTVSQVGGAYRASFTGAAPRWRVAIVHPTWGHVVAGSDDGRVYGFDANDDRMIVVSRWRAPVPLAIVALGWEGDDPAHLVAQTADGTWWPVPSCANCAYDGVLIARTRERLTKCEAQSRIEGFSARTKELLGIKLCPPALKIAG